MLYQSGVWLTLVATDVKIPTQEEVTKILSQVSSVFVRSSLFNERISLYFTLAILRYNIILQLTKRPENAVERAAAQLLAYAVYNKKVEEIRQDAINLLDAAKEDVQVGEALLDRDPKQVESSIQQIRQALNLQNITVAFLEHLYESEMTKELEEVFSSVLVLLKDYNNEQEVRITLAKVCNCLRTFKICRISKEMRKRRL